MSRSPCPDCPGCPSCGEELIESLCGKKLECLHCGALYQRLTRGETLAKYAYERHPWEDYTPEDPDDRPYIWDIEER